jgi:hypothetical protein
MAKLSSDRAHNETAADSRTARRGKRQAPGSGRVIYRTKMSPLCSLWGSGMILRKDASGRFWGCSRFPGRKGTRE